MANTLVSMRLLSCHSWYSALTWFFKNTILFYLVFRVSFIYSLVVSCMYIVYLNDPHSQLSPSHSKHSISSLPQSCFLLLFLVTHWVPLEQSSGALTDLDDLPLSWSCAVNYIASVRSWVQVPCLSRRHFLALFSILWLLNSFCPLFQDVLWALGVCAGRAV